jgi:hypothetical protein
VAEMGPSISYPPSIEMTFERAEVGVGCAWRLEK